MAKIYLSVIYSYLEDYPKAIKYERETREWAMKNKDYKNFLTIHNNILNSAFMNDQLISVVGDGIVQRNERPACVNPEPCGGIQQ